MRKVIFTIIILAANLGGFAQLQDSLDKANSLYASDEYVKAITTYENIIIRGYESANLYFNLGNAYYKSGDPVHAILYYEKAKLLAPTDEDIQFNLDLVNQFVVDKIEPLPRPFFVKWLNSTIQMYSSKTWSLVSILTFVLLLIFGLGYIFIQRIGIKKLSFALAIIMLGVSLTTVVFATQQNKRVKAHDHAIIFTPSVTVKASPNASSVDLFVIHEGLKVEIINSLNEWLEIKLEDGNRGWVKQEILKYI